MPTAPNAIGAVDVETRQGLLSLRKSLTAAYTAAVNAVRRIGLAAARPAAATSNAGLEWYSTDTKKGSFSDGGVWWGDARLQQLVTADQTTTNYATTGAFTTIPGMTSGVLALKAAQRVKLTAMLDAQSTVAGSGCYAYFAVNGTTIAPGTFSTNWPLNLSLPIHVLNDYTVPADGNYTFDVRVLTAVAGIKFFNNPGSGGGSHLRVEVFSPL